MLNKMLVPGVLVIVTIVIFSFIQKKNYNADAISNNKNELGIHFNEGDWSKTLEEAKKQNKLIFLDAYASWCGPCKLLKKYTFTDKDAGEFFNKNFINAAIDMEKGDGPALSEKYGVNGYPTLIIADSNGNVVTYTQGYIRPKQLIAFGKYGLEKGKNN